MAKHNHLYKQKASKFYYFRRRIPNDLQEAYGKKWIQFSLKTSDIKEAVSKVHIETLRYDHEFAEKRRQLNSELVSVLAETEVERIVAHWLYNVLHEDEQIRLSNIQGTQFDLMNELLFEEDAKLRDALTNGRLQVVESELNELIADTGIRIAHNSHAYNQLAVALLKTMIKTIGLIRQRQQGIPVDTPPKPIKLRPEIVSYKEGAPTLRQLHTLWAEEHTRAGGAERTINEFGTAARRFSEFFGDIPVNEITKKHVREFKDFMLRYPAHVSGDMRQMTAPQLIEISDATPGLRVLSPATVNDKMLGGISAILAWGEENAYLDYNPASKVKVKAAKVSKTVRLPYSVDDLNKIFQFPIYTQDERPDAAGGEAAKWIPLIAAFTGARLEEIGQLLVDDIKNEQGVLFFDLKVAVEGGQRRKTESSKRRIPIHSRLIECGLLEYAKEMKKQGRKRLFPDLPYYKGKCTISWSKWWGRYARMHGNFGREKVFHSFRHAFKDGLREGGVQEEISDALTGHATHSEGRKYGGEYPLQRLHEGIEKLSYPGLILPKE